MNMVVVMGVVVAGRANRILGLKLLVGYAVQNSGIHKLSEAAVNGGPVYVALQPRLQVAVRECPAFPQKNLQNGQTLLGLPETEFRQEFFRRQYFHAASCHFFANGPAVRADF